MILLETQDFDKTKVIFENVTFLETQLYHTKYECLYDDHLKETLNQIKKSIEDSPFKDEKNKIFSLVIYYFTDLHKNEEYYGIA